MRARLLLLVPSLAAVLAPTAAPAQSGSLYDPTRLVQVDITLPAADWLALRVQHRDLRNAMAEVYRYFEATVVIDGEKFERVGVRKKGLLGSVVSLKPSLKIRFDEFAKKRRFRGLDQLTLNNNIQDPTQLHQCLAYGVFRKAGAVAPRCNLAVVTVNGEKLGIYSNVESIRKPFIKRAFGESKGKLYEGYAADFDARYGGAGEIADKWPKRELRGPSPIDALKQVLARSPLDLAAVRRLVDVDGFVRMWACESLIGHWDGYASNRNNYYMYLHAGTGRLCFIPWGADSVFADPGPFIRQEVPKSLKAIGALCRRLWTLPAVREQYAAEMRRLLREVWIEDALLAEAERLDEMIDRHRDRSRAAAPLQRMRGFIAGRRKEIEPELRGANPDWPEVDKLGAKFDNQRIVELSGSFSATLGKRTDATLVVERPGAENPPFDSASAILLPELPEFIRPGHPTVLLEARGPGERVRSLVLVIDPILARLEKPDLPVDHYCVWAMFTEGAIGDDAAKRHPFMIYGQLVLETYDMDKGATIAGKFNLKLPVSGE